MASTPVLHHRALGVHPGAFVQSSEPATSDIQDGCLWIDVSTPAPYQMRCWRAGLSAWEAVGVVALTPGVGLPPGVTGDLLLNVGGSWAVLPPGQLNQQLTMEPLGSALAPQWVDSCCGTVTTSVPPVPPTDVGKGSMAGLKRCGAALSMSDFLQRYYGNVKAWLNYAAISAMALATDIIARALVDAAIAAGITLASLLDQAAVRLAAQWIRSIALAGFYFDTLTSGEDQTILKDCYCTLASDQGTIAVTQDSTDAWAQLLEIDSYMTHNDTATLLGFLVRIVPPAQWQALANQGTDQPTGICSAFDCGIGKSMQGRAVLGVHVSRSMSGRAVLGITLSRSMSGRAVFGVNLALSMQGHAHS